MLKRVVMLIVLGLVFSSCDFVYYGKIAVYENMNRIERDKGSKKKRWTFCSYCR